MKTVKIVLTVLVFSVLRPAVGNGYGNYPSDIAWSDHGEYLLARLDTELVLVEVDGDSVAVISGDPMSPSISPGGRFGAFTMDGGLFFFPVSDPSDVRSVPWATHAETCFFDPAADPEEPVLVYASDSPYGTLHAASPTSAGSRLLNPEGRFHLKAPVLSPGGTAIACVNFATNPTWYEELFLLGGPYPHGTRARRDSTFRGWSEWHESNPVWLTDGELLFQIGGWGDWELRVLNIETREDSVLIEDAQEPSAALEGRLVAFCRTDPLPDPALNQSWEKPTMVMMLNTATGYLTKASGNGEWAVQPALSPDGEHIAWIRITDRGRSLVVRDTEEFIGLP